jgi:hypothetical protein
MNTLPANCPQDVFAGKLSLHTPWKRVYSSSFNGGVLDIGIDWRSADIDSLNQETLRAGWDLRSDDGDVTIKPRLVLTGEETHSLLDTIREVTGNDYSEAPADAVAALAVTVSNELKADDENHLVVSVTNRGPSPAYRVVAQLNSRTAAIQGIKLSFGRIDRGQTKKQTKDIVTSENVDTTIEAAVTSSNAPTIVIKQGLRLKSKTTRPRPAPVPDPPSPPLALSCSSQAKQVIRGRRIQVLCEAYNPGNKPVKNVTFKVSVADATSEPAAGPLDLAPQAPPIKFDVDVAAPTSAPSGPVSVTVTANAPDAPPISDDVEIDIVEPHKLCKPGDLTIDDYRRKHGSLDEDLSAGMITKEQFNDILAELWTCVRSH